MHTLDQVSESRSPLPGIDDLKTGRFECRDIAGGDHQRTRCGGRRDAGVGSLDCLALQPGLRHQACKRSRGPEIEGQHPAAEGRQDLLLKAILIDGATLAWRHRSTRRHTSVATPPL